MQAGLASARSTPCATPRLAIGSRRDQLIRGGALRGHEHEMTDRHYAHLVLGAEDSARGRLDEWAKSVPRDATAATAEDGANPLPD